MKQKQAIPKMLNEKEKGIVEFCSHIISNKRVGSRYEGHDITQLWQLGDKIISTFKPLNISFLLPKLQKEHELRNIRYDDRLYRASIIFREYWKDEGDYKKIIQKLNVWTKLRELYPICKSIVENKHQNTREEVSELIDKCNNLTYMEVRDVFIRFRKKTDRILSELGIDEYEFSDLLINLSEELRNVIENDDFATEKKLREIFGQPYLRNFRLLLSALQKEDVYQNRKWNSEIKKIVKMKIPTHKLQIAEDINSLFTQIAKFITKDTARQKIRDGIPVTFIGNLSTYLRAIESEANKEQFKKNKEILTKFIGKLSS